MTEIQISKRVAIARIDKSLPLPKYETDGSVGFDLLAREEVLIEPGKIALIPANVIIKVPEGFMLMLASRSSTPGKKGLSTPHGVGIIDLDYHGPNDELKVQVYNFTQETVTVHRADKVAQGVFVRVNRFEFEEGEITKNESRGGFGSTD